MSLRPGGPGTARVWAMGAIIGACLSAPSGHELFGGGGNVSTLWAHSGHVDGPDFACVPGRVREIDWVVLSFVRSGQH